MDLKVGQIYRSETHPEKDLYIEFMDQDGDMEYFETKKEFNEECYVCWVCSNRPAFDKFLENKGINLAERGSTHPYSFTGECTVRSFKQRLKKYNLKLVAK